LEKVRSRTMAMQKSEELTEASFVLYQQFKELGEPADQLTIGIVNEEENIVEVSTTVLGIESPQIFKHSIDEPYVMKKMYKSWKAREKSFVLEQSGKELRAYNEWRNEFVGAPMFPTDLDDDNGRMLYVANYSKGMLAFSTNLPRPRESLQLLERFAAVFDLTYTRFLDLKKAEAQAREARIEAALERTRTQSMLMQHSRELDNVLRVFHEQVLLLAIDSKFSFLWLPDEDKDRHIFWAAWAEN